MEAENREAESGPSLGFAPEAAKTSHAPCPQGSDRCAPGRRVPGPPLPLADSPTTKLHWGGLRDLGLALAVAEAAQRQESPPLLLVLPDVAAVERVRSELEFFLGTPREGQQEPRHTTIPLRVSPALRVFPDWETLPYDAFSPYADIVSERLKTLAELPHLDHGIVLTSISTLMHYLPPVAYLRARSLELHRGATLDPQDFRRRLAQSGYRFTSQVCEHGEVAIRGALIDIFPMGTAQPCRIDLDDQRIDSLRLFDPASQRSTGKKDSLRLLPAHECPLEEEAVERFRCAWRAAFPGDPRRENIYREVSAGRAPPGIEYYLPLFFEHTALLFDYLPKRTVLLLHEDSEAAAKTFLESAQERYEAKCAAQERPVLPPARLFTSLEALEHRINAHPNLRLHEAAREAAPRLHSGIPPQVTLRPQADLPSARLQAFLQEFPGRVLLAPGSQGRRETLLELLRDAGLRPGEFPDWQSFLDSTDALGVTVAPLERGLFLQDPPFALLSAPQLFQEGIRKRRGRRRGPGLKELIQNLSDLRPGSPVVHREHGVGRYRGLVTLYPEDYPEEFLQLEYAGGDLLYVPTAALDSVSRYTGMDPEHAPLHRLGGEQWERVRSKATARIRDTAAELLELHARRAGANATPYDIDEDAYQSFCATFPFEETEDQEKVILEVLQELRATTPMDRLVCGDSGFGKTEVALRAAFVTANNSLQTVLLAPTTLLAEQHYHTFCDRFANWPVRIEVLSRFARGSSQRAALEGLANGAVDIVIGTHKLLRKDLRIRRLGLVIIDEEHRFGVHQKERLKQLKAEVNILSLTATPIPRTLNLALSGMRGLSLIATPPARRLPVKTFICEWSDSLLREAMLREMNRGGQIFFIHNRIETIQEKLEELRRLLPEGRIKMAHGKLPKRELERVMLDFRQGQCHVLLCTTIVETGLDIPNANTLIINQAQRLGLAQIYQLRGRVGRSHHNAYAYLITPNPKILSENAKARLRAVAQLDELGVGFNLAGHDLEIRGAGEILGEEQSGHIQELGFGMYMDLLRQTIEEMKSGVKPPESSLEPELLFHLPALFPEDYLPDLHARMQLYRRLAATTEKQKFTELKEEVIDRFGRMPQAAKNLFQIAELKTPARSAGVLHAEFNERGGKIIFHEQSPLPPERILELIRNGNGVYRFQEGKILRVRGPLPDQERIQFAANLLQQLTHGLTR